MKKILLALVILSAGAGGFLIARQSTIQLELQANATREVWLAQTQFVAVARNDQASLVKRIRGLKQNLAQAPVVQENVLWSALQTNRADRLPRELRERLLEELGFNWQCSPDFIWVTKQTLRDIGAWMISNEKVSEVAATILEMTPQERGQVEAALQQAQADFNEWALTHVKRIEPKDDVVAHYTMTGDRNIRQSMTNNLAAGILAAVGQDRAELMQRSVSPVADDLARSLGQASIVIKRGLAGTEQVLKVEGNYDSRRKFSGQLLRKDTRFPPAFRPIFPNGWADVAERESFELPEDFQQQQLQSAPPRSDENGKPGTQPLRLRF